MLVYIPQLVKKKKKVAIIFYFILLICGRNMLPCENECLKLD